jgi:alanyl-tRNA synthetase
MRDNVASHVNAAGDEITVEIWNLVFMQYDRDASGKLTPLPRPGVDTGMGFERMVRVLQHADSTYDTDLFMPILDHIQELAKQTDAQRKELTIPYRVVADHTRAATFLIGDGVLPGNDGRNYVLRMILRRAARFGRKLGFYEPFLYKVSEAVIEKMGGHYTELVDRRERILNTIRQEEERFARTLDQGLERLDQEIRDLRLEIKPDQSPISNLQSPIIPGDLAFKLYDTFGLPFEITRDEAKERGFEVDEAGYLAARDAARERNRARGDFDADFTHLGAYREAFETLKADGKLPESGPALAEAGVDYNPYDSLTRETTLVTILRDGEMTDHAVKGEHVEVVLAATPFYVESGGQVSDTGLICAVTDEETDEEPAWCLAVKNTIQPAPGFIVHECVVEWGEPRIGDPCTAQVDEARRWAIERNHTATHLLQKSLRTVLGAHITQQGSLVAPDRLRFDFSHNAPLTQDELDQVSDMLNDAILDNMPVTATYQPYQSALAAGALAFFSEKYGDVVRVVRIGEEGNQPFSVELCGGTHVDRTGDIGSAVIVSEGAVAAGVRRIEALTGRGALDYHRNQSRQLHEIARVVNATPETAAEQTSKAVATLQETQKSLVQAKRELARVRFREVLSATKNGVSGPNVLVTQVDADSPELLREMSDWYRERYHSGVAVLGAVINDKPALLVSVSQDLTKKGIDAGKLIREIAQVVGGSGGGKPTLAQAGGKDASKLGEALEKARQLLANRLES